MPRHDKFLASNGFKNVIKTARSKNLLNPSKYYIVEIIGVLCQDPANIGKLEEESQLLKILLEYAYSDDKELKQAALAVLTNVVAISSP